jgi:hypothetical protein
MGNCFTKDPVTEALLRDKTERIIQRTKRLVKALDDSRSTINDGMEFLGLTDDSADSILTSKNNEVPKNNSPACSSNVGKVGKGGKVGKVGKVGKHIVCKCSEKSDNQKNCRAFHLKVFEEVYAAAIVRDKALVDLAPKKS